MKKLAGVLVVLAVILVPNMALAAPWTSSVTFTNTVASTPFRAGGYPVPWPDRPGSGDLPAG